MSADSFAEQFSSAMDMVRALGAPWPSAVAVSGGGDSVALMHLLHDWACECGVAAPVVLSVDHGLVAGSAEIARSVTAQAESLGLTAYVLPCDGPKPGADVEAWARQARYTAMGVWCRDHDVRGLFVAHTQDDQAETFLLRLARGSGLDGLSAMRPLAPFPLPGFESLRLVRPLLGLARADVREFLKARGLGWFEDPMNSDGAHARVRIRQAWPVLSELGLIPERIAAGASHLSRARDALEARTAEFLSSASRVDGSSALLDVEQLSQVPPEIALRALACLLMRISGQAYRPRFERLQSLCESIRNGKFAAARTLHGCRIARAGKDAAIFGSATIVIEREGPRRNARDIAHRGEIS